MPKCARPFRAAGVAATAGTCPRPAGNRCFAAALPIYVDDGGAIIEAVDIAGVAGTFNLDMEARLPIDGVTGDASAAATTAGLVEV